MSLENMIDTPLDPIKLGYIHMNKEDILVTYH